MTIEYPRKCKICDYLANNPAMYFYHIKTHDSIPQGTLCHMGCGELATVIRTSGKYVCSDKPHRCKGYRCRLSNRITNMWASEDCDERKKQNGERIKSWSREKRQIANQKLSNTKREKRQSLEWSYDRKKYNRAVLYHSNKNYKLNKEIINPTNKKIGLMEYHLDHKVSQFVGYVLGIPIDIISSIENLEVIPYHENTSKCNKCSLHPIELLEKTGADEALIDIVNQKLSLVEHLIKAEII